MDTQTFICKAKSVHGDLYDYSNVKYVRSTDKVIIGCPIHGDFLVSPHSHLKGSKCRRCAYDKMRTKTRKLTKEEKLHKKQVEFIKKANLANNNKYTYDKTRYINTKTKAIVTCPTHGDFEIWPNNHLRGHGCDKCHIYRGYSTEEFIDKVTKIFPEYDYKLVNYVNNKKKVRVICNKHGVFEIRAGVLLSGSGCRRCANDKKLMKPDELIAKLKTNFGDRYDYSKINYIDRSHKITLVCPKHGDFEILPGDAISGHGCLKCYLDGKITNTESFIEASKRIHGDNFDYSNTIYKNSVTRLFVRCNQCGSDLRRSPSVHLNAGCGNCNLSLQHKQINEFVNQFADTRLNDRTIIEPLEIDIFVPEFNFGIEVNGLYWHSYNRLETKEEKWKHYTKTEKARAAGITLIQIFENEWKNNSELLKSMIMYKLRKCERIYARCLQLKEISDRDARAFYEVNHMQSHRQAKIHLALVDGDTIYMCTSYSNTRNSWELIRMASRCGYAVCGGSSKLLKKFRRSHHGKLITFADLRYSNGHVYEELGFSRLYVSEPNYFYYRGSTILSRQRCQKKKLPNLLQQFDPELSESQNMFMNGYRRVWDAGHLKFSLEI